jgi:hypothetical protein
VEVLVVGLVKVALGFNVLAVAMEVVEHGLVVGICLKYPLGTPSDNDSRVDSLNELLRTISRTMMTKTWETALMDIFFLVLCLL